MATIKAVETLAEGDIATFKQDGRKLGQFRRYTHEKITKVTKVKDGIKVATEDKKGFTDAYVIPAGTEMRVHKNVNNTEGE